MRAAEAERLGVQAASLALSGDAAGAVELIAGHAARRTPFAMLDRAGSRLGSVPIEMLDPVIADLARTGAEGAWPVIGSALAAHIPDEMEGVLARCHDLIAAGGVWYATDILAERVPGPALVSSIESTARFLAPWRFDDDRWIRRAVGVAVHSWAKRAARGPQGLGGCKSLLEFLLPMLEERHIDAAKGVGWALKTIGRYRGELLVQWLNRAVRGGAVVPGAVVLRKAVTYLPEAGRRDVLADWSALVSRRKPRGTTVT